MQKVLAPSAAMKVILLLGLVSLFGDIIYEGARSVSGPYLMILGASAFTVASVSGLGEFVGYAVRMASGYFADRGGSYWAFTIAGYLMIGAIPLLVFAGTWQVAVILLLIERLGKAIRSPSKDTILSQAAYRVGRGWGFGIHEALDQIGAVAGPLLFAGALAFRGGYGEGFALLAIPFILLVASLILAWRMVPEPESPEKMHGTEPGETHTTRILLPYGAFTVFSMAGFLVFPLMAYHFSATSTIPEAQIPLFFAVAMAVDALSALLLGKLYDRRGLLVLSLIPIANIPIAPLAFSFGYHGAFIAAILWGFSMGGQETILRAALADLTSIRKRGFAYGIFNALYGGAWFVGSILFGLLYSVSLAALYGYAILMQSAALGAFLLLQRTAGKQYGQNLPG